MPEHSASDNPRNHRTNNLKRKGPLTPRAASKANPTSPATPDRVICSSVGPPFSTWRMASMPDLGDDPEVAIKDMKSMTMQQLNDLAEQLGMREYGGLKRQDLIFRLLQASIEKSGSAYGRHAGDSHRRVRFPPFPRLFLSPRPR